MQFRIEYIHIFLTCNFSFKHFAVCTHLLLSSSRLNEETVSDRISFRINKAVLILIHKQGLHGYNLAQTIFFVLCREPTQIQSAWHWNHRPRWRTAAQTTANNDILPYLQGNILRSLLVQHEFLKSAPTPPWTGTKLQLEKLSYFLSSLEQKPTGVYLHHVSPTIFFSAFQFPSLYTHSTTPVQALVLHWF